MYTNHWSTIKTAFSHSSHSDIARELGYILQSSFFNPKMDPDFFGFVYATSMVEPQFKTHKYKHSQMDNSRRVSSFTAKDRVFRGADFRSYCSIRDDSDGTSVWQAFYLSWTIGAHKVGVDLFVHAVVNDDGEVILYPHGHVGSTPGYIMPNGELSDKPEHNADNFFEWFDKVEAFMSSNNIDPARGLAKQFFEAVSKYTSNVEHFRSMISESVPFFRPRDRAILPQNEEAAIYYNKLAILCAMTLRTEPPVTWRDLKTIRKDRHPFHPVSPDFALASLVDSSSVRSKIDGQKLFEIGMRDPYNVKNSVSVFIGSTDLDDLAWAAGQSATIPDIEVNADITDTSSLHQPKVRR